MTTMRRLAASAGIVALACTGLAGTAAAAEGNIDPNQTGSILIHKHEDGTQDMSGTADGQTMPGGTGVAGAGFTAYKITNVDLTDQTDWSLLQGVTGEKLAGACAAGSPVAGFQLSDGTPATFDGGQASALTSGNGETSITGLNVAAYLVCETTVPANAKTAAAPFLVTIPFPNNAGNAAAGGAADGTNWLYDVNVYPKNTVVEAPTKGIEVQSSGAQTEGNVYFPVTVKVPSIADDASYTKFVVYDPFVAELTQGDVVKVELLDSPDAQSGTPVPAGNYVVTPASGANNNTASVGFNKDGLTWLKQNAKGKYVRVTFKANASAVTASGELNNVAYFDVDSEKSPNPPDNPPTTPPTTPPGQPSNAVVSSWGDVKIQKQDSDNSKPLTGATFEVYGGTEQNGECVPTIADFADTVSNETQPISVGGLTQFTTGSDGTATISGLFIDRKVGAAGQDRADVHPDKTTRCYVLKEVAAPAGYVLPSAPDNLIAVKVTAGQTAAGTYDAQVKNTKETVPNLPLTGAQGVLLLSALGVGLTGAGVGVYAYSRRRQAEQD